MNKLKQISSLALCIICVLSITACNKDNDEVTPKKEETPIVNDRFGESVESTEKSVTFEKDFSIDNTGVSSVFAGLGEFENIEAMESSYLDYAMNIKNAISLKGHFVEIFDQNDNTGFSTRAFDTNMKSQFTITAYLNGYQDLRCSFSVYKIEHEADWDSYDFADVIEDIDYYTGVKIDSEDVMEAISIIKDNAREDDSYSILFGKNKEASINISVLDYNTDMESWQFDILRVISDGTLNYAEQLPEGVPEGDANVDTDDDEGSSVQ